MNNFRKRKTILVIIFLLALCIISYSAIRTIMAKKHLVIYNFNQLNSSLSPEDLNDLEGFLYDTLVSNENLQPNTDGIEALIRNSSYVEEKTDDGKKYNFLVDVDDYHVTYEVGFYIINGKGFYESPSIGCPEPELMKFQDTSCNANGTSSFTVTIGDYLPYSFDLDTGEFVTLFSGYSSQKEEYIEVEVSSCGDQAIIEKTKFAISEWIESIGYNPTNYKIEIPELCDGEGH
ncbi:hypothetical protein IKF02_03975 [Candidatus Saccharibacteria bacterium]|nr:hypothetical protein [Candidatus Saccharibacteria bacterium]MBR3143844.1 hypothetical protein [Candidatus Saccharibacteria bacterium]